MDNITSQVADLSLDESKDNKVSLKMINISAIKLIIFIIIKYLCS